MSEGFLEDAIREGLHVRQVHRLHLCCDDGITGAIKNCPREQEMVFRINFAANKKNESSWAQEGALLNPIAAWTQGTGSSFNS